MKNDIYTTMLWATAANIGARKSKELNLNSTEEFENLFHEFNCLDLNYLPSIHKSVELYASLIDLISTYLTPRGIEFMDIMIEAHDYVVYSIYLIQGMFGLPIDEDIDK